MFLELEVLRRHQKILSQTLRKKTLARQSSPLKKKVILPEELTQQQKSKHDQFAVLSSPFVGLGYNVVDALFDKRKVIATPQKHPWSIHGYLRCVFADGTVHRGTGTMISKNCLLTAGHCLYNEDAEDEALKLPISLTYFSGMHGNNYFLKTEYRKVFIHTAYKESNDENFDFGVVQLDKDIGEQTGWASLKTLEDKALHSLKINVTGSKLEGNGAVRVNDENLETITHWLDME